jgi:uncharacterized membrane protein YidH (DUF202 family)
MKEKEMLNFSNTEQFYNKLNTTYYAMFALPLIIFLFFFLKMKSEAGLSPAISIDFANIIIVAVSIVAIAEMIMAFVHYKKTINDARKQKNLKEKLSAYFKLSLVKYTHLMVSSFIILLGIYLTANGLLFGLYFVVLMLFTIVRPSILGIGKNLRLNEEEKGMLKDKHAFEE